MFDKQARYEMIAKAAKKVAFKNKMQVKSGSKKVPLHLRLRKATKWTEEGEADRRAPTVVASPHGENHNEWTDAEKYVSQHYGSRAAEVAKFDNDWD